ncbi:cytochrome c oxidase, subunit II [Pirellula staleyi DSM 6068]|uniref:Cytochrome c oxidase subunit 2 n=1 Tax=Pirellula staleyi (strain ATCC 27377 / DSM 6068 / ICPB 4128) TaxID=530564 RepID=D2R8Q4_PIRSD|nr:cytochrome c oxidase subunit II [Pirellula staleyi]ADB17595.1 cytochrome c oxidase, subunit II [Pirellula staleyi DSM 6068]
MGRFWSLFFLMVPILGVGIFAWAMADLWPLQGHWLPENINDHGKVIDNLFMFILYLTGIIFVGTGVALFWFLWKYDVATNTKPIEYTHGSHTLEVVWSIIPAAALLFIAIYQMNAWADAKMRRPQLADGSPKPAIAEVTGRQFEWRIRYAGADGVVGTPDDVLTVNELRVPANEEIVLAIKSQDVLHSFFLPNLRLKQDVVPGMKQFVWFRANKTGVYDIVCAELCGWGHYKMRGRITVQSRADFDEWLAQAYRDQNVAEFTAESGEGE